MDNINKELLKIIKAALTDTTATIDENTNEAEIIELANKHTILPLVVQGLFKCGSNSDTFNAAKIGAAKLACYDAIQSSYINKIKSIFEENSIDYALLKGSVIKNLYSSSVMRLMGDIDILIREEQYDVIKQCMLSLGFTEGQVTDHELKWVINPGIVIELHKRLIPSYNDDYYEYYKDHWSKFKLKESGRTEYAMRPEDEYIFLFTHMTKHYRDGGIGLRHIIDLWLFKEKNELDSGYILNELSKIKLDKFYQNILLTIDVWFNEKESNEISDFITKRIIEYGSLNSKELMDAANAARQSARSENVKTAKSKNLKKLIFMPYKSMCIKYPFLKYLPILMPVMWVVRWLDAILNKRANISMQYKRLNKIEETTVSSYNQDLEFVGLSFDLKKE